MKFISSSDELMSTFKKAINKYKKIAFSVAWASANHDIYKLLISKEENIENSSVGLNFHQTHPEFIKKFLNKENVFFIDQIDGVFHPKIYLFWNSSKEWTALIGSANFTHSAMTSVKNQS